MLVRRPREADIDRAAIGTETRPLRVAIVGTGPAGFFAAQTLTRAAGLHLRIDLVDRLPTPYGLVRGGVAPDHANIKRIALRFARVGADPRVRFFGNVELGRDLTLAELQDRCDAVLLTTGASDHRRLGVPGEDLDGICSATTFVGWYNGHPDHADLSPRLEGAPRVVVVGNGNVALDVARVLSLPAATLQSTDVAPAALDALSRCTPERVELLGRRGAAQAAFTAAEVRELGRTDGLSVHVDRDQLPADAATGEDRALRELATLAARPTSDGVPIHLRFCTSVSAFLGDAHGRLRAVRLVRNALEEQDGRVVAIPTDETWEAPCQLAITAVGYRGHAVPGVPFDAERGVVPADGSRVREPETGAPVPGLYTAGWIRRGPSGVIGTNKPDAQAAVSDLLDDLVGREAPVAPPPDLAALLSERGVRVVDWAAWERIDADEQQAGAAEGRPRRKHATWDTLLQAAGV